MVHDNITSLNCPYHCWFMKMSKFNFFSQLIQSWSSKFSLFSSLKKTPFDTVSFGKVLINIHKIPSWVRTLISGSFAFISYWPCRTKYKCLVALLDFLLSSKSSFAFSSCGFVFSTFVKVEELRLALIKDEGSRLINSVLQTKDKEVA